MVEEHIDVEDIEAFIDGLKKSFDSLDEVKTHQGFQMQLAKAISSLREKKISKIEPLPKFIGPIDMKEYLLTKLEDLKNILETDEIKSSKKFNLVMEIAKLREKLNEL
ncbi:MAG: hypothetical protein EU532_00780 [Promethearchaeota archaeon]|nr:MAG: hypothetical protein EU532_00780 [Candidatus Lokiarchaeota archaeon]